MEYDKVAEIKHLLDVWFDGETTCEQENRLREYFMSDDVPADLLYAKTMFDGFSQVSMEQSAVVPVFGDKCAKLAEEHTVTAGTFKGRLRTIYTTVSIAASLMIALGVTWLVESRPTPEVVYCYVNGEPVTDINIAARQAQMATRLIEGSVKVSADGIAKAAEASKPIDKLSNTLRVIDMAGETTE